MNPVNLRLRGTFIDFYPQQNEFEGGYGRSLRVRSRSSPPLTSLTEDASQNSANEYLEGLVSRTMQLSDKALEGTMDSSWSKSKDLKEAEEFTPALGDEIILPKKAGLILSTNQPQALTAAQLQGHTNLPDRDVSLLNRSDGAMQEGLSSQESLVTTLMIRNIPYKMTLKGLIDLVDSHGFAGTYDFLHLPGRGYHFSNLGYAFINFCASATVVPFIAKFHGVAFSKLSGINTEKIIEIRPARAQGLAHNIAKVRHIMSNNDGSSLFIRHGKQ